MLHDKSYKLVHFVVVKRSRVQVTTQKVPAWVFALLWVRASSSRRKSLMLLQRNRE